MVQESQTGSLASAGSMISSSARVGGDGPLACNVGPADGRRNILESFGPRADKPVGTVGGRDGLLAPLVGDSYGNQAAVNLAQDTYNTRPVPVPFLK